MARRSITKVTSGLMALCCVLLVAQAAKVYNVGDSKGWSFGVAGWDGKPFAAGDVLVFKYGPNAHNVVEVDEAGYNACKASAGAKTHTSGNDHIKLPGSRSFFICSFPGHCKLGMKIAVTAN